MKYSLIILLASLSLLGCKTKKLNSSIKFELTETSDYCGGAVPPEELLEKYRTPKPFGDTLYLHQSKFRADDGVAIAFVDGKAIVKSLNNGEYFAFLAPKFDVEAMMQDESFLRQGIDAGCLHQENLTPEFIFTVVSTTKNVQKKVHKKCNPCLPPAP